MAKHPEDPRAPQPNDKTPPRRKPVEPDVSDTEIELGELGQGDLSGVSVIEWASLVDEPVEAAEPVVVDSPSDADLIRGLKDLPDLPPAEARVAEDELAELIAEAEFPAGDAGDAIDLTAAPDDVPAAAASDDDFIDLLRASADEPAPESAIDLGSGTMFAEEEAIDLGQGSVIDLGADAGASGSIDLGDSVRIIGNAAPAGATSAVDLGADSGEGMDAIELMDAALVEEDPVSDVPIDLGADDVIDLGDAAAADDEAIDLEGAAALVEGPADEASAHEIDLALFNDDAPAGDSAAALSGTSFLDEDVVDLPAGPAASNSSRDLIAEGLESGVGLLGRGSGREGRPADDDDHAFTEDFLAAANGPDESSSVDLGSLHTIDVFKDHGDPSINAPVDADGGIDLGDMSEAVEGSSAVGLATTSGGSDHFEEVGGLEGSASTEPDEVDISSLLDEDPPAKPAKKGVKSAPVVNTDDEEEVAPPKADKGKGKKVVVPAKDADDEEDAKPKKKAKSGGGLLGGTLLGGLLATAACAGVYFGGVVPNGDNSGPVRPGPGSGSGQAIPQVTFDTAAAKIRSGDLEAVNEAELAKIDDNKADHLVSRAVYNYRTHLRKSRGADPKAKLTAADEGVKSAIDDLTKAVGAGDKAEPPVADALFLRGQIHEDVGNAAAARQDYAQGAKLFAATPEQKARFENALALMDLLKGSARLAPEGFDLRALAVLVLTMQQPPLDPTAPPAPPAPPEAGYKFWQAIKLMNDKKPAEAIKALDEARAAHDRRRYLFPLKQQNPDSDPREQIFLKATAELRDYWALSSKLANPAYLTADAAQRVPAVDALLAKVKTDAEAATLKDIAAKLVKDGKADSADELAKLIDAERTVAATKLTDSEKAKEKAMTDLAAATKKIDAATAELKTKDGEITKLTAAEKAAAADGVAKAALLKDVALAANSTFVDVKTSRDGLLRDLGELSKTAKMVDPMGVIKTLREDVRVAREKLAQRRPAAELMDTYAALLQAERGRADLAAAALADVDRVLADPASTADAKGKAMLVKALAERNAEKYTDAAKTLEKAAPSLKGTDAAVAAAAKKEVDDPSAEFARKAAAVAAAGKPADAVALLTKSIDTATDKKGPLLLQRARIAFETARTKGEVTAADAPIKAARADALAAAKEGLAEGWYVAGRIAEETKDLATAKANYLEAIKAHGKSDGEGSRYKIALARVLLKTPAAGRPSLPGGMGRLDTPSLDALAVLMTLTLQGVPSAEGSEAEKLAEEVLALGDKAPFDARAQALAIKGLHTRALTTYTDGLRANNLLAPEYANTLLDLIGRHPALRRPDALATADPVRGEKHYQQGLAFFASKKYADAEKEFVKAVENDNADARYFYYLGLSRLAQGKNDAYEDFDQGAKLEQSGKPGRAAVSAALERVQGRMRAVLNEARSRPAAGKEK